MKATRRTRRVLSDVLERVRQALIHNPDFCPEGLLPIGGEAASQGPAATPPATKPARDGQNPTERDHDTTPRATRRKRPQVRQLTPSAVIRRLKLGQQGLSCCVDYLGADGPECTTEGTVIYLNRDHPLHQRMAHDKQAYVLYIARLLTQEIAMMKQPRSPRQAFERQSKLLRDALAA